MIMNLIIALIICAHLASSLKQSMSATNAVNNRFQTALNSSPPVCDQSAVAGFQILKNPLQNKGMTFTINERDALRVRGLLPAGEPQSLDVKIEIAMSQLRRKATPIEKYIFLHTIQDADETLFYAILCKYTKETMPLVYTPTVGQACQEWGEIYRHTPRGFYVSLKDKGMIRNMLDNYPLQDVKAVVLTDGERILGLGDLGVNGMGIPIGKLALYTACAGINPAQVLPVHIDVGTNNEALRDDPSYMGLRQPRERGPDYDALIQEFFDACQEKYGRNVLMQFEDFGNLNAFRLLENFREKANCFNDDIQGTASVVLGGLMSTLSLSGKSKLSQHRYLFLGAGEAGTGIADLISSAIVQEYAAEERSISLDEVRKQCFFVDSRGLITKERALSPAGLEDHKKHYAHDIKELFPNESLQGKTLLDAIKLIKPTALIGVSAQGGAFTKEVCEEMANLNERPLILPLSNPTSKAECTAEDAYTWTNGAGIVFSGSPFDPVKLPDGREFVPGQGNNAYIFPGVGLGSIAAGALTLTDQDMYVAAAALASQVTEEQLKRGTAYPPLSEIREVSARIAAAVAHNIYISGRSSLSAPPIADINDMHALTEYCKSLMYEPEY